MGLRCGLTDGTAAKRPSLSADGPVTLRAALLQREVVLMPGGRVSRAEGSRADWVSGVGSEPVGGSGPGGIRVNQWDRVGPRGVPG